MVASSGLRTSAATLIGERGSFQDALCSVQRYRYVRTSDDARSAYEVFPPSARHGRPAAAEEGSFRESSGKLSRVPSARRRELQSDHGSRRPSRRGGRQIRSRVGYSVLHVARLDTSNHHERFPVLITASLRLSGVISSG